MAKGKSKTPPLGTIEIQMAAAVYTELLKGCETNQETEYFSNQGLTRKALEACACILSGKAIGRTGTKNAIKYNKKEGVLIQTGNFYRVPNDFEIPITEEIRKKVFRVIKEIENPRQFMGLSPFDDYTNKEC